MYGMVLLASSVLTAPTGAPAPTVCLQTTITEGGRTRDTRIVESSGNRRDYRGARRYLEIFDFARMPLGVTLGQTGHLIVEVTGPDSWRIDVTGGRLHDSCAAARAVGTVSAPSA